MPHCVLVKSRIRENPSRPCYSPPPLTLSLFFLIFALSPQSERLEPRLPTQRLRLQSSESFVRIVDSIDVRFSQTSNWFSLTLHSFFELLLQAILTPGHKLLFHIQLSFWCNPNFFRSRLLTSPDFLHHSESISKSINFRAIFQDIIYKASTTWKITFPHFSMILPKKMILPSLFQSFSLFFFPRQFFARALLFDYYYSNRQDSSWVFPDFVKSASFTVV